MSSSSHSTFEHPLARQPNHLEKTSEKSKFEALDGVPYIPTQPIMTHHATDVLKPSAQITLSPLSAERPKLTPPDAPIPRTLSEYRYLKLMNDMKDRTNAITETMAKRIDIHKQQINKISDENIEKLKANAEKAKSSEWWTMLKKLATALLSALTLGLGLALLSGGGSAVAGAALVSSGVLSLANFACNEAGVWDELAKKLAHDDEEKRNKIGLTISIAVGVLSCGLGLYGGVQNIALNASFIAGKIISFFQLGLGTFQGVTTIGQGIAKATLIRSDADLSKVQAELDIERIHLTNVTKWIENFIAEMKGINEKASQATRMVIDANQRVAQQFQV